MKKIYHLKNIVAGMSLFFVMVSGFVQSSFSQDFISRESRPRWGEQYENFSNYDLRKYPGARSTSGINPATYGPVDPVTFDRFGNFLLPGGDVYSMAWAQSYVGASQTYSDNARIFNRLMISSDDYSNWVTKFIIGENLRAYFTPSTLKRTNFDGIRWDASTRKNSFTFLASIGTRPPELLLLLPLQIIGIFLVYTGKAY